MTIRAGPLLLSLLREGEPAQLSPAGANGAVLAVLVAGLLLALLLDRLRR